MQYLNESHWLEWSSSKKVVGATRGWQLDLIGRARIERSKRRPSTVLKSTLSKFWKISSIIPPRSLILLPWFLLSSKYILSFSPTIPLRRGDIVVIESADALFDFNAKKRKYYKWLFKAILKYRQGSFVFYSLECARSFEKLFPNLKFSTDFIDKDIFLKKAKFKKNQISLFDSCEKENPNYFVLGFVGDFYLKGGYELLEALKTIDISLKDSITLLMITSKSAFNVIKSYDYKNVEISLIEFNEKTPDKYFKVLASIDCLMHPTFYDSHAIVCKEAKEFGAKVACTDILSCPEVDYVIKSGTYFFTDNLLVDGCIAQRIIDKYSDSNRQLDNLKVKSITNIINNLLANKSGM